MKPTISDAGNGHGWEEMKRGGPTSTPLSSAISRATASSSVSPGSTKPASAE
jgi:hypothetical protein